MTKLKIAKPVRKVAFTCDFFRAQASPDGFVNYQTRLLAWLEHLVGARVSWSHFGVNTSVVVVPEEANAFKHALGNNETYLNYLQDADQTWASLYDNDDIVVFPEAIDKLLEQDLVVGFELPPTLKRALHRAGKSYISFYVHPIRFLRDLCFLVTTNSSEISSSIAQLEVPENEVDFQVRKFSAMFAFQQLPSLSLPDDVPILIGQTEKDSVLIRNGSFTHWENYEEELFKLLKDHPEVIFLEHPRREKSTSITEYLRGKHGKTVISVRGNSYGIIFSPLRIPLFLTLASSLGLEARCARRESTFLHSEPCTKFLLNGIDIPRASMVSHGVFQDEFWKAVFSGEPISSESLDPFVNPFLLGNNFIRSSLDSWAYKALETGTSPEPVHKLVLPASSAEEASLAKLHAKLVCRPPVKILESKTNECTHLAWGTVEELPKPYTAGQSVILNFANASISHYLAHGFHSTENWGVWSSGDYSKIILPMNASDQLEVMLDISMTIHIYESYLTLAPSLRITLNDKEVGVLGFQTSVENKQNFSFKAQTIEPICKLEFFFSTTKNSLTSNYPLVTRKLTFAISAFNVGVSKVDTTGTRNIASP